MPPGRVRAQTDPRDRNETQWRSAWHTSPASIRPRFLRWSSAVALRLRQSAPQDLREDDGFVVLAVASAVDERQRLGPRHAAERRQPGTLAAKLRDVASPELVKAARLVSEPLPQLGARCQLFVPLIELRPRARNPARPQPVHQQAVAVRGRRRVIRALQANVDRAPLRSETRRAG